MLSLFQRSLAELRIRHQTAVVDDVRILRGGRALEPGVNVTGHSFVLLTPRANLGGRDLWFRTDPAANIITIRLSSPRPSDTKISWLLLG